jgi:hypothetical protein
MTDIVYTEVTSPEFSRVSGNRTFLKIGQNRSCLLRDEDNCPDRLHPSGQLLMIAE